MEFLEITTSSAPSFSASARLLSRGRERDGVRAHRVRELDAHVTEPTDADDADFLAGPDLPVAQRRIGRDAGTEQRRDRGELFDRMTDLQHELLVDDDALRVAAERMTRRVFRTAVVGADEAVLAVLLETFIAGAAMLATADHATDADDIARCETGDVRTDGADATDDLVAGHTRIPRAGPLGTYRVQIGMTDAAERDVDLYVIRSRGPRRGMSIASSGLSPA